MFATPSHVPKLLPWVDWLEWREVYDLLATDLPVAHPPYSTTDSITHPLPITLFSSPPTFSPSTLTRHRLALHRISLWRLRGRLPLHVDSTAALLSALHLDASSSSPPSLPSPSDSSSPLSPLPSSLRVHYSLALLRFVNATCDPLQSRATALSLSSLASTLRLPRLLIDVRHSSTHSSLPSLSLSRLATHESLRWLFAHYWHPQAAAASHPPPLLARLARWGRGQGGDGVKGLWDQTLTAQQLSALLIPALFAPDGHCLRPPSPPRPLVEGGGGVLGGGEAEVGAGGGGGRAEGQGTEGGGVGVHGEDGGRVGGGVGGGAGEAVVGGGVGGGEGGGEAWGGGEEGGGGAAGEWR